MLVSEGFDRNETTDRRLASVLSAIAGALNTTAFYEAGFFSANMTGNVSTFSSRIATGDWIPALFYFSVVLAFISGAATSTLLINAGRRRYLSGVYAYSIMVEAVLLYALGCADLWLLTRWRVPVLVLGLAFLMGIQNAIVTRISGARVRTTHVSGIATDIGIELAIAFDIFRGCHPEDEAAHNRSKLRLHFYTIISFLTGGIVGVVIYRAIGGYLLILSAGVLLVTALTGIARSRSLKPRAGTSY